MGYTEKQIELQFLRMELEAVKKEQVLDWNI
jgi:hypothetical protein